MSFLPLSISVVVFKTPVAKLQPLFDSIASLPQCEVSVVDNFGDSLLQQSIETRGWLYMRPGKNLGYGRGHNHAIKQLRGLAPYHLVVNPDVSFAPEAIEKMLAYMAQHADVGQLMPRVTFPSGDTQYLCKLLPAPADLILRRFLPDCRLKQKMRDRYELRNWSYAQIADIPVLSGCFMLLRRTAFDQCKGFDERYFMYLEDTDLCRRIGQHWRTVYFPEAVITHDYAKGSYTSWRLLAYHTLSAVRYFNKWGWLVDPYRRRRNARAEHELGL